MGEKENVWVLILPYDGCHMRGVNPLCVDRQGNREDQFRAVTVDFLDHAGGGCHRGCHGVGVNVHPLFTDLEEVESI